MCGRVAQAKNPTKYGSMLKIDFTRDIPDAPPHYNGAPSQDYLVVRVHPRAEDLTLDMIRWGLLPWLKGPNPGELLKTCPSERMIMWPVSPKLNSPKNDSPDLLEPIRLVHRPAHRGLGRAVTLTTE
jgi:putative SOS response-associated peptidase YedK